MRVQSLKNVCSGVHAFDLGYTDTIYNSGVPASSKEIRAAANLHGNVLFVVAKDQTTTRRNIRKAVRGGRGEHKLQLRKLPWSRNADLFVVRDTRSNYGGL